MTRMRDKDNPEMLHTPAPQPQEYIITEEQLRDIEAFGILPDCPICKEIRSRPTPSPLTKFVEHLSRINQELNVISGKLENLQKIIDADEMTSDLWDDYANLEGWREALDWAILADSDHTLEAHDTATRNATLDKAICLIREREINSENPKGWLWRNESLVALLESLRGEP